MGNNKNNNLKTIRKSRNLTIKEVVEGTGIPMRTYQNYEYCEREIGASALSKLADFYHVTTDYLLRRETTAPEPLDDLSIQFNMTALEKKILDNYLALPKHMRTDMMEFLHKSVKEVMEDND